VPQRVPPVERRCHPRQPKAFAFWFAAADPARRCSGWMLNTSEGGAAFLTARGQAPRVGERIALAEMVACDRVVREDDGPLPPFARVLRHDDTEGITCRVAVRFETDARARRDAPRQRATTISLSEASLAPRPDSSDARPDGCRPLSLDHTG
jgi:hypothetical protein